MQIHDSDIRATAEQAAQHETDAALARWRGGAPLGGHTLQWHWHAHLQQHYQDWLQAGGFHADENALK
ncbi:hypothetical protein MJ904_00370 [Massilia sp. MB5]|uniref:hypothetical protein n=1 Tax=unclassified Massilia TaxID=2609279 RepID=UPI00067D496B|nr:MULTISPECIES: hypothetical protein [unclassified Massilia]AKU24239.1 hypothetical protein ACZ75_25045 [Massilia sp. NR 4-1]UMR30770.1 hypothetical protein MJ904_00370 [Massilia sp. MB5]